jgi:hypothetical protein
MNAAQRHAEHRQALFGLSVTYSHANYKTHLSRCKFVDAFLYSVVLRRRMSDIRGNSKNWTPPHFASRCRICPSARATRASGTTPTGWQYPFFDAYASKNGYL